MSWNIDVKGGDKQTTLAALEVQLTEAVEHCPIGGAVIEAAARLFEKMPDRSVTRIATSGHINADGTGYATVRVNF